ncbi:response regulator transcription factor [Robbsia andropogonis]|uniref:response regulator transcription factor n=1 Tax=Robbsia andropogonis TaxID=28092 RepID=UPI002A6A6446|nr:response regulator transcription factor [Robbsia andropogonis]
MPDAIRVMVVDDEPIMIEGLRAIIGRSESMTFVGGVRSPEELFSALGAIHCDVLVMDYLISDEDCGSPDGLYLLRQIRVSHPSVRTILYTSLNRAGLRESALALGVDAILCKRDPLDVLTKAILVLASGAMCVAPSSMLTVASGSTLETGPMSAQPVASRVPGRLAATYAAMALSSRENVPNGNVAWSESGQAGQARREGRRISNRVTGKTLPLGQWTRCDVSACSLAERSGPATEDRRAPRTSATWVTRGAAGQAGAPTRSGTSENDGVGDAAKTDGELLHFPDAGGDAALLGERGVWMENRPSLARLSPRETEIVRLLSNGRSLKEVAAYVGRSPKTVSNQKRSAMLKLGLLSYIDLLRFAIQAGLT